jgi:nitrite reductase/ring-hydroxylating ferredoxin subunit
MTARVVCSTDELAPGERLIVDTGGREIAVFNMNGEFVAVANYCVHAGGPVCEGKLSGTVTASVDE